MSLSRGSPGSILFRIPSRPAIIIAEKPRYGLQDGSGGRNSTRLALGLAESHRNAAGGRAVAGANKRG